MSWFNGRPEMRIFRLLCQGCNRKGRAAYTVAGAVNNAVQDGWQVSPGHTSGWCRRCSSLIVAGA